jgi:hypothetical protein
MKAIPPILFFCNRPVGLKAELKANHILLGLERNIDSPARRIVQDELAYRVGSKPDHHKCSEISQLFLDTVCRGTCLEHLPSRGRRMNVTIIRHIVYFQVGWIEVQGNGGTLRIAMVPTAQWMGVWLLHVSGTSSNWKELRTLLQMLEDLVKKKDDLFAA